MARVPYLDEAQLAESDRDLLRRPVNIFRALANSPDGLRSFNVLGEWIRWGCTLDSRIRELAILQVGYLTRSRYEYSHHVKIGRDFGVTDDDIRAIAAEAAGQPHHLGELETAVLRAAREVTEDCSVSSDTWAALRKHLEEPRIVDLLIVIGFYNAVVRVLGALQVDVEPEYEGYLEEFPLPAAGPGTEGGR